MVWLVLTLLGTWRHNERWIVGHVDDSWTLIDGVLQVAVLPVWFMLKSLLGYTTAYSLGFAAVANGVGFALLGVGNFVLRLMSKRFSYWLTMCDGEGIDPRKRRLVLRAVPEAVVIAGAGAVTYATLIEPWRLKVARLDVPIADLPRELDGIRVLHLTDMHRGPRITASFLDQAVKLGLQERPDLVVLTGDYVHQGAVHIHEAATIMKPLAATTPCVGVLGNHDWFAGASNMQRSLESIGVRMIDNSRCFLGTNRALTTQETGLCLAGVGDLLEDRVDFQMALGGVDPKMPRLLLSHNPDTAEMTQAGDHRIDLMLSGHTHGGQVLLPIIGAPGVPSRYGQKYRHGLVHGPKCRVYISAGVGMSVAPFRFGVRPEINLLTLRRA